MSALIIQSVNEVMHIGAETRTYRKTGRSPSDPCFSVWFSHRTLCSSAFNTGPLRGLRHSVFQSVLYKEAVRVTIDAKGS